MPDVGFGSGIFGPGHFTVAEPMFQVPENLNNDSRDRAVWYGLANTFGTTSAGGVVDIKSPLSLRGAVFSLTSAMQFLRALRCGEVGTVLWCSSRRLQR